VTVFWLLVRDFDVTRLSRVELFSNRKCSGALGGFLLSACYTFLAQSHHPQPSFLKKRKREIEREQIRRPKTEGKTIAKESASHKTRITTKAYHPLML